MKLKFYILLFYLTSSVLWSQGKDYLELFHKTDEFLILWNENTCTKTRLSPFSVSSRIDVLKEFSKRKLSKCNYDEVLIIEYISNHEVSVYNEDFVFFKKKRYIQSLKGIDYPKGLFNSFFKREVFVLEEFTKKCFDIAMSSEHLIITHVSKQKIKTYCFINICDMLDKGNLINRLSIIMNKPSAGAQCH